MTSVIPEHPEILAVLDVREKCHAFCHSSLMDLGFPYWLIVSGYVRVHYRVEFQCGQLVKGESMAAAESRVVVIAVDASDHAEKAFNCK